MKKKRIKKINFGDIRYPKQPSPKINNVLDKIRTEQALSRLKPLDKKKEDGYEVVRPLEDTQVKANAQSLLNWVQTCDSKDIKVYYQKITIESSSLFPISLGWFIKYTGQLCEPAYKNPLTSAEVEKQAAQTDIWLKVWNIPHEKLKQNKSKYGLATFFYNIAIERKFGTKHISPNTSNNTPSALKQKNELRKNTPTTSRQKPTQDTKQPTKDTSHNDFITFVIQHLKTWHQEFSQEYKDVIQIMQSGKIAHNKLQDKYQCVDPAKKQRTLELRTAQMKREIQKKIQPLFSNIPDATDDEKREIEKEIIKRFFGKKIAQVLDNVDIPHT